MCQRYDEFEKLNARVVLISFGTLPGLQVWMKETCEKFEVLLDPNRETYHAYQLERSRLRSWTPRTMWMYAKLLLAGRKPLVKEGDASQLGGDFIIDAHGRIKLAYRSFDPVDRPSVDTLLDLIREILIPQV